MALVPTLLDDTTPLAFMVEIPATRLDIPARAVLQRVYVDANTHAQNLRVSLVFEDGSLVELTHVFNTSGRDTGEWSFVTTKRRVAIRIEHTGTGLTDLVEIFGIEIDVYIPTVIASASGQEVGR